MFLFIIFVEQCQTSLITLTVEGIHGCVAINIFVNY